MKKSKLSVGLVTSFIASMALAACSSNVSKSKTDVVTFTGYDGNSLSVLTDKIYDDYMKSSTGIAKYYDQVMEVLIRNAFQKDKTGSAGLAGVKKNYNQIVNEAKDNVKGAKNTAKQNAETNGTTYKKEWQSILSEKGVKDEEELLQYYIYQLEKEEIEDWYYEKHEASLKQEYLGIKADGTAVTSKASSRFPYHVRHILIKVEDGGSEFARGTISADQAKLLSNTVDLLAQGVMTFGEVAQKKSEDSSASSYGDVGLMTNAISGEKLGMVNEFQLGIYAYDAITKNAGKSDVVDNGLGLNKVYAKGLDPQTDANKVKSYFASRGIVEIPYSVFKELGDVADLETNYKTGLQIGDGKSAIFPRNLLWNTYLNNHSIFVITNGARNAHTKALAATDPADLDVTESATYYEGVDAEYAPYQRANETDEQYTARKAAEQINYATLAGFKANTKFAGDKEKVLSDESGNVIIGVRSEYGIHLMIVQKSAYDYNADVKLDEYYTTAIPGDSDFPKNADGTNKVTYVNFIDSVNKSEYNTRAEAVKTAIKGFDSTYDYRLYEELIGDKSAFDEKTKTLFSAIDGYIDIQREKNSEAQKDGLETVWQTYVELLQVQDYYRHTANRVLPEGCKIAFSTTVNPDVRKAQFEEEGGVCYVK